VAAFQAGWEALRAGQPLVARAHFDRARDPAVAEDATYWAAVASERAGEPNDAARRYRSFAQAFPSSPRAADARAAAARLYDR
jgi:TolA-binding protein